jgi:hypothetical protein
VIDAHADPALVVEQIIDAARNCFAENGVLEIMYPHIFRLSARAPGPACILEIPHEFLLLGVDRDRRLPAALKPANERVDVLELGIAIRMRLAFPGLARSLSGIATKHCCDTDGQVRATVFPKSSELL